MWRSRDSGTIFSEIFNGIHPEDAPAGNRFLNYLSSNYTNTDELGLRGDNAKVNVGRYYFRYRITKNYTRTAEADKNYYLTATDKDSLEKIFQEIVNKINSPTISLGADTVIKDVVTPHFNVNTTSGGKADTSKMGSAPGLSMTYTPDKNKIVNDKINSKQNIPQFTPGAGWVKNGNYYYYTQPVAPNEGQPAKTLIDSITLIGSYPDADGGKQVIEVMAEAIQEDGVDSSGQRIVVNAWGVDPETLKKLD